MLTDALILDAVRTPIGKLGGALSGVRPDDLAATALRGLLERHPVTRSRRRSRRCTSATPTGPARTTATSARMAVLLAGLPVSDPGSDGQPVVRVRARGGDRREPRRCRRRCRPHHRRRGRVDDPRRRGCVLKPSRAVPHDARADVELGARLADGEPDDAQGVDGLARRGSRDPGRRVLDLTRGAGRLCARVARAGREGMGGGGVRGRGDRGARRRARTRTSAFATTRRLERLATLKPAFREGGHGDRGQLVADERRLGGLAPRVDLPAPSAPAWSRSPAS